MNYSINLRDTSTPEVFEIVEKDTDHVVSETTVFSDARKILKRFNSGSGFAGWTPAFVLTKFKVPSGTND